MEVSQKTSASTLASFDFATRAKSKPLGEVSHCRLRRLDPIKTSSTSHLDFLSSHLRLKLHCSDFSAREVRPPTRRRRRARDDETTSTSDAPSRLWVAGERRAHPAAYRPSPRPTTPLSGRRALPEPLRRGTLVPRGALDITTVEGSHRRSTTLQLRKLMRTHAPTRSSSNTLLRAPRSHTRALCVPMRMPAGAWLLPSRLTRWQKRGRGELERRGARLGCLGLG